MALANVPVPELVHNRMPKLVAEAALTVKEFPWHTLEFKPASAVGTACKVSNIPSEAVVVHGAIEVAFNVRITLPEMKSAVLGE